ncbi:MAG: hypothetical protein ABW185_16205, partial [Sedimenticola sp.]
MEPSTEPLTLLISAKELTDFCRKIVNNSSNTARKHAALITLEGFITEHAGTEKYTATYNRLLEIIDSFSEKTRA